MLVTAALVGAVLIAFAVATRDAREARRDALEQRFDDQARITASVIESAFGSGVPAQTERYSQALGSERVDRAELEKLKRESELAYAVVLDARGELIAATAGLDARVRAALAERPAHVADVVGGAPWRISGIVRGAIAEYVSPFPAAGGTRILLQGFPVSLISGFVGGSLASLPDAGREQAFVVDGMGRLVAAADPDLAPGAPAPRPRADGELTSAKIGHTDWTVILTADTDQLFTGVDSTVQWLVLLALAIAGALALYLLSRAFGQTAKLHDAYAELERTNVELARTNVELQRSNSELEQFASVASHDLQEPLRKVQTFGDQLERRHGDSLDAEASDYLNRMRNAASRMSVLIDDLLRFSRVTTHARPHVSVSLRRVAQDVVTDLEALVAETGGEVHVGALEPVQADPLQMRQLLQNLIGNALKFHRPGVPPVVRLQPARAPALGQVAFTVSDNGIGFEDSYRERIFKVFERLHPRDVYPGTGIGLALCRKIAERHGGTVTAEAIPGAGATFTVVLEAAQGAPAATGREAAHV